MKIDFTAPIRDLKGKPILDGEQALTLKSVATNALLAADPDEKTSGEDKMQRFKLALEIENADTPLDLKVEQVATLKLLVARLYVPLVVGRAYEIFDA